eukprot:7429833-Pyramimonas_sp.AAC.1
MRERGEEGRERRPRGPGGMNAQLRREPRARETEAAAGARGLALATGQATVLFCAVFARFGCCVTLAFQFQGMYITQPSTVGNVAPVSSSQRDARRAVVRLYISGQLLDLSRCSGSGIGGSGIAQQCRGYRVRQWQAVATRMSKLQLRVIPNSRGS